MAKKETKETKTKTVKVRQENNKKTKVEKKPVVKKKVVEKKVVTGVLEKKNPTAKKTSRKKIKKENTKEESLGIEEQEKVKPASRGKKQPYLSVVIPAYNEAKRLPITLADVDRKIKDLDVSYEILVANDGSTDNTAEIVKKFEPLIKGLRLVDNEVNRGKGAVVRQGMLEAVGEVRLFMDADNSTSVDQFAKMRPYFVEGEQIVIGSRALKESKLQPAQPILRRILGKAGNLVIQALAVPKIWDTQCGFKAFSAKATVDIFNKTLIDRWAFDIEALAIARKMGYKIKEIPVVWINDLSSHVKPSAYFEVLWETVKIWWRLRKEKEQRDNFGL